MWPFSGDSKHISRIWHETENRLLTNIQSCLQFAFINGLIVLVMENRDSITLTYIFTSSSMTDTGS